MATATERLATLERLAAEAADLAAAAEQVRLAREEVLRIQTIGSDVDAAERSVEDLARKMEAAEQALKVAQVQQAEADAAFESAEEAAPSRGIGSRRDRHSRPPAPRAAKGRSRPGVEGGTTADRRRDRRAETRRRRGDRRA